jgi:transcriptional regulator with XRE-family HTH domain
MNSNIGDKIKTMREQRGFTQLALAKRAGVAQSTLSYIEKDAKAPRFETLQALCRAMDITLLELLICGESTCPTRFLKEREAGTAHAADFEQYLYLLLLGNEAPPIVNTPSACESEISI